MPRPRSSCVGFSWYLAGGKGGRWGWMGVASCHRCVLLQGMEINSQVPATHTQNRNNPNPNRIKWQAHLFTRASALAMEMDSQMSIMQISRASTSWRLVLNSGNHQPGVKSGRPAVGFGGWWVALMRTTCGCGAAKAEKGCYSGSVAAGEG